MRHVREQLALRGEQARDPLGHLVEARAEHADLVLAIDLAARGKLAFADRARGAGQSLDRAHDPARGQHGTGGEHDEAGHEREQRAER